MKKKYEIQNYRFFLSLIISTLLFTAIGYIEKRGVYGEYSIDLIKTPQLAAVFEGIGQGKYPWSFDSLQEEGKTQTLDVTKPSNIKDVIQTIKINYRKWDHTKKNINILMRGPGKHAVCVADSSDGKAVPDQDHLTYQFQRVDKDYFNDALFIGDSRTVGLSEYSGWTKPTFFADVGLTIYDVLDKQIVKVNKKTMTVEEALKEQSYRKIYIMLGINELGRGTTKTFIQEYKTVLDKIRQLQPNAIIYVEGIMKVSKQKSDSDPIFNNKNITDKNQHLVNLADNKNVFYIDVNKAVTNKSGNLPQEYTFDSIHLKAAYYKLWTDFLQDNGIIKNKLTSVK
jgi:Lysophospholipase L1 and related esterases